MAVSDIEIVGLTASGGPGQIVLQWAVDDPNFNGLPALRFDHVEVRRSTAANMSSPTTINATASTAFADVPVAFGATRYYQVRAVDRSDGVGAWSSVVSATESNPVADLTPWTSFVSVVTPASGSFTSLAATAAFYKQIGSTCFFMIEIGIITNGTAGGFVQATLPFVAERAAAGSGVDVSGAAVNKALSVFIAIVGRADIFLYDGTYPGVSGHSLFVSGSYEINL